MTPTPDVSQPPHGEQSDESALLRYWHAQPGSALFLIAATAGCAVVAPLLGVFPEGFGIVRQVAAGALIGWGFGMLPIAHRIWD